MLPGVADGAGADHRPLWLVCEDGSEYIERFSRFLSGEFRFAAANSCAALLGLAASGATGVLLDLDFRRTPAEELVDEEGGTLLQGGAATLPDERRRQLAASQGILILRQLRRQGQALPVLLCADLAPDQAAFLASTLGPLQVVPSAEGLRLIAERLRKLSAKSP